MLGLAAGVIKSAGLMPGVIFPVFVGLRGRGSKAGAVGR